MLIPPVLDFLKELPTSAFFLSALAALISTGLRFGKEYWEIRYRKQVDKKVKEIRLSLEDQMGTLSEEEARLVPLLVSTSAAQAPSGAVEPEDALAELRDQIAQVTERLEKHKNEIVEVRTIDPVLEATLKLSIDNLTRRLEALEERLLTKWDMAVVTLQLLGGIGIIFSVVFAALKYYSGK